MLEIAMAIIPIVLMLTAGIALKKYRILRVEDAGTINKIILYATLPAFAFVVVYEEHIPLRMIQVPFMVLFIELAVMGLAWVLGRLLHLDRQTIGGLMLASAFGNTGFMGYPVVGAVFPQGMATAVIFDNFGMALPLNTVGVSVAARMGGEKPDWRQALEFLRLPVFGMTVLALLIRWISPDIVPGPILESLRYLMQATVPLVMISLGLTLSWSAVRGSKTTVLLACFLKLIVFPALMILLLRVFPLPPVIHRGAIFEAAMPSAMMTGVIATRYHANGRFVSAAVVVTTLLSVLTLPVLVYYYG